MMENKIKNVISLWYDLNKEALEITESSSQDGVEYFTVIFSIKKCILGVNNKICIAQFDVIVSNGDISVKKVSY